MEERLTRPLTTRKGHFKLESGHHGNLRLDLDSPFMRIHVAGPGWAICDGIGQAALGARRCSSVRSHLPEEGALLAQMVASALDAGLFYSERSAQRQGNALYSVGTGPERAPRKGPRQALRHRGRRRQRRVRDPGNRCGPADLWRNAGGGRDPARPWVCGRQLRRGQAYPVRDHCGSPQYFVVTVGMSPVRVSRAA
jgi:hypothetical protein